MAVDGRRIALAVTADGEVDLIRGMVDLLRPLLDRVVIAEGNRTFHGAERDVRSSRWAADLNLAPSTLRTVVTDLPSTSDPTATLRQREMLQRAAIGLAVLDLDPGDLLIAVDSDEYVDPAWLRRNAGGITAPTRLHLVPLFGGLDRRAPDWHCCRGHLRVPVGQWPPRSTDWLFPGGVVGPLSALPGRGVADWRARADASRPEPSGWHLLHVLAPGSNAARKLGRQAHKWDRGADRQYMDQVLAAGIHPYGWWGATAMPVPAPLKFLARRHPEVVRGPLPPERDRETLLRAALTRFQDQTAGEQSHTR